MNYGPPPSDSDEDDCDGFMFSTDYDDDGNRRRALKSINPPIAFQPVCETKILQQKLEKYISSDDISGLRNLIISNPSFKINDTLSDFKWTPLLIACQERKVNIVRYLLFELNADPNVHIDMWTPLMVVCNANKNLRYDSAFDPLEESEVLQIVEMLLSRNAVINMHNMMGETALMYAAENGYTSVVNLLIEKSVAIEAVDNEGKTALSYAVKGNRYEVTKALIEAGACTDVEDRYNNTPKRLAQELGYEDIETLFPPDEQIVSIPNDCTFYSTYKDYLPISYPREDHPVYAPDVFQIIRGMKSKLVEYKLYETCMSISDLLTANNDRLQAIGVKYPFQRKRILLGILRFHEQKWLKTSLYIPKRTNSVNECFQLYSDCLRSITILKCSMRFIEDDELFCGCPDNNTLAQYRREIDEYFFQIMAKINKLLDTMKKIEYSFDVPPPLHVNEEMKKRSLDSRDTFRMKCYRTLTFAGFGLGISLLIKKSIHL